MGRQAPYKAVKTPSQRGTKESTPHPELGLLPAFGTVLEDEYMWIVNVVKLMFLSRGDGLEREGQRGMMQTSWTSTEGPCTKALEV